jgi:IS5 family transposase
MGADTKLIAVYLWVCDRLDRIVGGARLRHRGFEPKLSDAEVLTMEIVGELLGLRSDAAIWRYFKDHWWPWFPGLGSSSNFAKQCANLHGVKQALLAESFMPGDDVHLIDGFPVPVCHVVRAARSRAYRGEAAYGYCASKDEYYYGFKGHLTVDRSGRIVHFTLTAANIDERQVLPNLFGRIAGWLLGDKGYLGQEWRAEAAAHGLHLVTPLRSNMNDPCEPKLIAWFMTVRRRVETAIGQVVEAFSFCEVRTHDLWHLTGRLARKLLAYNLSLAMNDSA